MYLSMLSFAGKEQAFRLTVLCAGRSLICFKADFSHLLNACVLKLPFLFTSAPLERENKIQPVVSSLTFVIPLGASIHTVRYCTSILPNSEVLGYEKGKHQTIGENNIRLSRENMKTCSRPMRRIRQVRCKCANLWEAPASIPFLLWA